MSKLYICDFDISKFYICDFDISKYYICDFDISKYYIDFVISKSQFILYNKI